MSRTFRKVAVSTLAVMSLSAAAGLTGLSGLPLAHAAAPAASADFNGDGYADIAVGVPGEDLSSIKDAGSVQVFYGGENTVAKGTAQTFTQNSPNVPDQGEAGDRFGAAVAMADFDGDGFTDLAVGIPGEDLNGLSDVGAVEVLFGSSAGLTTAGNQFLSQATPGSANSAEAGDRFGTALAAGNITGGSQADLAVGVPYENVGSVVDAGAVHVLPGSGGGLTTAGDQLISQNTAGAADKSESGDRFGSALAIADMVGGSQADLAVGIPLENVGKVSNAGAVQVFPGSASGVSTSGDKYVSQNTSGVADKAEKGDHFGAALAAGNVGGSSKADLVIGIPLENVGSVSDAGAIAVLRGSTGAISTAGDKYISQNSKGANDKSEKGDQFGAAVAVGNVAGSSLADVVVGIPLENISGKTDAGAVQVFRGSSAGVTTSSDKVLWQSIRGSDAASETKDHFGAALATANVVGSSFRDVIVGVPLENVGSASDGGTIQIFRGASAGVTVSSDQVIQQDSSTHSYAEDGDKFGSAVAAG